MNYNMKIPGLSLENKYKKKIKLKFAIGLSNNYNFTISLHSNKTLRDILINIDNYIINYYNNHNINEKQLIYKFCYMDIILNIDKKINEYYKNNDNLIYIIFNNIHLNYNNLLQDTTCDSITKYLYDKLYIISQNNLDMNIISEIYNYLRK